MSRYASKLAVLCLALLAGVSACVTTSVYFPAAAAEKAADRIIDDVWGTQGQPTQQKRDDDKRSTVTPGSVDRVLLAAGGSVLALLVAPAHAQGDLNIATPAIRQLIQSMQARHVELKKYYDSGAIGLTRDGLVELRDQNLVPLPDRNTVRKLVSAENADRANLYREIPTANGHPEWETDIRATFAERWASKAAPGWYYQDSGGTWKQK